MLRIRTRIRPKGKINKGKKEIDINKLNCPDAPLIESSSKNKSQYPQNLPHYHSCSEDGT